MPFLQSMYFWHRAKSNTAILIKVFNSRYNKKDISVGCHLHEQKKHEFVYKHVKGIQKKNSVHH